MQQLGFRDDNAFADFILSDALVADRELQGIVQCDTKAEVGRMVHLIDLLRAGGVTKYAIATEKPPKEGEGG